MPLNKQQGNMYPWVTHTWNPIRGCKYDCVYCYVKSIKDYNLQPRIIERELRMNLRSNNTIFVCSTADMFGQWVSDRWIMTVLDYCRFYDNTYFFQTKNPERYADFADRLPPKSILGTTLETNRHTPKLSHAPMPFMRYQSMVMIQDILRYDVMISIEPIVDFDLEIMILWVKNLKPRFVSIGADSKSMSLPEPPVSKIIALIHELRKVTEIRLKSNLTRIGMFIC